MNIDISPRGASGPAAIVGPEGNTTTTDDWGDCVPPECYAGCPPHDPRYHNERLAGSWYTVAVCAKCGATVYQTMHPGEEAHSKWAQLGHRGKR